MTKKITMALVLALFTAGIVFAQARQPAPAAPAPAPAPAAPAKETAKEIKNSFSVDLFPLVKGFTASGEYDAFVPGEDDKINTFIFSAALGYERFVKPNYTFGAGLDFYFGDIGGEYNSIYFALYAQLRWYLMKEEYSKLFLGADIGINTLSNDGKTENGGFFGLFGAVKIGYRILGKGKMYAEPSISYVTSKIGGFGSGYSVPTPIGLQGGFRLGWVF